MNRPPESLTRRDWGGFITARREGRVPGWPNPAGNRAVEYDVKFMIAVRKWAVGARLITSNPRSG